MVQAAVLGTGAWGTALAIQIAKLGKEVNLWGRNSQLIDTLLTTRHNDPYLPGIALPDNIHLHKNLSDAISNSEIILCVVPTVALRGLFEKVRDTIDTKDRLIAWASKGIEQDSGLLIHEVALSVFGEKQAIAAIGGPTFAAEMAAGKPTAAIVASSDHHFPFAELLHGDNLRIYTTNDIVGVEVGGALKNVIALASGICDSLALGDNAKAALLTRGLNEILNFAVAAGGSHETILGLAGLGDLALSCFSQQSRNYLYGVWVGKGCTAKQALDKVSGTVESHWTTPIVIQLANTYGVAVPICEQINKVLTDEIPPHDAVQALLSRPSKIETLFQ